MIRKVIVVLLVTLLATSWLKPSPPPDDRKAGIEALHDLFKAVEMFHSLLNAHDLLVIHNYDNTISLINTLRQNSGLVKEGRKEELQLLLSPLMISIMTFHSAADASDQARADKEFGNVLSRLEKIQSLYPEDVVADARSLPDKYICPMHPEIIGGKGDSCPKCGMKLEPAGAFSQVFIQLPPIQASVHTDIPLTIGKQANGVLSLMLSDSTPVRLGDLREMHTKKIHLFIIDSSLTDYHHEHPQPKDKPGSYSFSFTPRKPGPYRVWADLVPVLTGRQEYAMTDIVSAEPGQPLSDTTVSYSSRVEELTYTLIFDDPELKVGIATRARLRITQANGKPFTQLEPIMAAFAHLVGFSTNHKTIMHIHPIGIGPQSETERGGPELEFFIYPTQAGFMRLFAQVQIGGVSKFAPFGIRIAP